MFHVKHAIASVAAGSLLTDMTEHEHVGHEVPNVNEASEANASLLAFISEPMRVGPEGSNVNDPSVAKK